MLWYPIPGFPIYAANWDGEIQNTITGRVLKTYGRFSTNTRVDKKVSLRLDGQSYKRYVSRLTLSAKLGRELEPWEEARHIDGDPRNNSMDNLEPGCRLNNIIDEYELGRLKTSKEQIDIAIRRPRS